MRDALVLTRETGWEALLVEERKHAGIHGSTVCRASWEYLGKTLNKANAGEVGRHRPTVLARPWHSLPQFPAVPHTGTRGTSWLPDR